MTHQRSCSPPCGCFHERMANMSKVRLLIVHPEPSMLGLLTSMVQSLGPEVEEAANDRVAARLMERGGIDLVMAGVDPEDPDALELLTYARRKHRQTPVI